MVTMVNGGTEDREGRGVAEWDARWRVPWEQAPQVAVAGGRGGQRLVGVVRGWPHRAMGGPGAGRPLPLCGAPTKGGRSRSGGSRRLAGGRSENLPSTRGGPPAGAPAWTVRRDWWKVRCHHTSSASKVVSSDHTLLSSPVTPPRAYACAPPTRPAPSHPRLKLSARASLHTLPPLTTSRFVLPSLPPLACRRRLWPAGPRHGLCPRRCRRRPPLAAAPPRTCRGLPPPPALEDDGRGAPPPLIPGARCASIGGSGGRSGSSGGGTARGGDDRSPRHPSHLVHPPPPGERRTSAHVAAARAYLSARGVGGAADPPLVLYDGACGLCDGAVRTLLAADRAGVFTYAPLQGSVGTAACVAYGAPTDLSTMCVGARDVGRAGSMD